MTKDRFMVCWWVVPCIQCVWHPDFASVCDIEICKGKRFSPLLSIAVFYLK
jgi:hypothetical protein